MLSGLLLCKSVRWGEGRASSRGTDTDMVDDGALIGLVGRVAGSGDNGDDSSRGSS